MYTLLFKISLPPRFVKLRVSRQSIHSEHFIVAIIASLKYVPTDIVYDVLLSVG